MKKLILTLISGFFLFTNSFAQKQERKMPSPEERAKKKVERLADSIELSETQKSSLVTVFTDFNTKKDEIRKKETEKEAKKAEMKKLKEAKDTRVKAILNDDAKFAKYKSMHWKHGKKGKKGKYDKCKPHGKERNKEGKSRETR